MKILLTHPGTQHSFRLAKELNSKGLLFKFYTGFAYTDDSFFNKIAHLFPFLKKRYIPNLQKDNLVTFPLLEILTLSLIKIGINTEKIIGLRNYVFQQIIPQNSIKAADIIIGFDTSSWVISRRCKSLGKIFILDASIGHPVTKNKIFEEIGKKFPQWNNQFGLKKQCDLQNEKKEILNANYISVPSEFVKKTYVENNVPIEKILINPFGTDITDFLPKKQSLIQNDKITFLFFGALTARKGLPLLFKIWEENFLDNACQLIIAGFGKLPHGVCLPQNVTNLGQIAKEDRVKLFQSADVFIFPSYFEGFAQVLIEAAASGLPIISSYNSGASEIVENEINGFIISDNNEEQLKNAVRFFINNPTKISEMGILSRSKSEVFTWNNYGDRWLNLIKKLN